MARGGGTPPQGQGSGREQVPGIGEGGCGQAPARGIVTRRDETPQAARGGWNGRVEPGPEGTRPGHLKVSPAQVICYQVSIGAMILLILALYFVEICKFLSKIVRRIPIRILWKTDFVLIGHAKRFPQLSCYFQSFCTEPRVALLPRVEKSDASKNLCVSAGIMIHSARGRDGDGSWGGRLGFSTSRSGFGISRRPAALRESQSR